MTLSLSFAAGFAQPPPIKKESGDLIASSVTVSNAALMSLAPFRCFLELSVVTGIINDPGDSISQSGAAYTATPQIAAYRSSET
jgi:hypothetical protein